MPTYKYRCTECDAELEKLQTHAAMLKDSGRLRCAKCEAPMRHVFGVPAIKTPSMFYGGRRDDGFGNDDFRRRIAYARARAAGVNPTGKIYCPGLARPKCPNDPMAWVSQMDAEAEIRRRCRELNYGAEGDIEVKQREPEADPLEKPYRVADDILEREVSEIVAKEHGGKIGRKKRADLVEATAERLSGNQ